MDDYIYTSTIDDDDIAKIRKILKKHHIRRHYDMAPVYHTREKRNMISTNRVAFKTTFHNQAIKLIIQPYLPENLTLPESHHIDLSYYKTGHYFREHQDFVNQYPNNGVQVTIIIGLLTTKAGTTSIRVANGVRQYRESISKGGLLIFNSCLPHSGDPVVGEKEIVVLTGYLFRHRLAAPKTPLQFSQYYRCIAYYHNSDNLDHIDNLPYDPSDQECIRYADNYHYPPVFYLYRENRLRAVINLDLSGRVYKAILVSNSNQNIKPVTCFDSEQLRLIARQPILTIEDRHNPILQEMLQRKELLDIFKDISNSKTHYTTDRHVSYEMCNGLDDGWDEVEEFYTSYHYTRTFSITLYGKKYYHYWLGQLGQIYHLCFPDPAMHLISDFLVF
jgi:hypothetical protein